MLLPQPAADRAEARLLHAQAGPVPLGIAVHDHIIVGRGGHASLKGMKLI